MKADANKEYNFDKLVLNNVADIIVISDLNFIVRYWNSIAEFYYGISEAEAIGKHISELIQFTYLHTTEEQAQQELQKNKFWEGEISFTNKNNRTYHFLKTVKVAIDDEGKETGILAVGRDITEKKITEQKLLKSEQFYRTLIADSLDITLLLNAAGQITFSTSSVQRLLGYEVGEILGTSAFQYVHPGDIEWAFRSFEREVIENPEIKFILVRLRKKNGEWLWCMARGHNLLNNPYINSIAVYIHDDTPRKQAMDALKQSEKRFRTLIRDLHTGVLLQDRDGHIEMTNEALRKMFDIAEEDLIGAKIWELYPDVIHEDGTLFLQNQFPAFRAMQTRQLVKDVVMGVWREEKKEHIWLLISAEPILNESGTLLNVVCSFTDITDRKKLEKKSVAHQRQLAQATIDGQENERLEIGKELHDNIGQQLTTVKLFLDLARTSASAENAEMISMALKGVSDVINEIRAISRSLVPPSLKDLGFIDSVNDLLDCLRHTQAIAVELDHFGFHEEGIPDNKKLALFRIIQEQLNNIIKYADAKQVTITLRSRKASIFLKVKDDGKGFEWSKVRKGLGLANIANRAELFGGKADIRSSPGHGCTVEVTLPHSLKVAMTG